MATLDQGLAFMRALMKGKELSSAAAIALGDRMPVPDAFTSNDADNLDRCEHYLEWIDEHLRAVRASIKSRPRQGKFEFKDNTFKGTQTVAIAGAEAEVSKNTVAGAEAAKPSPPAKPVRGSRKKSAKAKGGRALDSWFYDGDDAKAGSPIKPTQETRTSRVPPKPPRSQPKRA